MSNNLSTDKKITAISMLCEGNSIRAIERMTGVHRDTIMRLGVRVGQGCTAIMDKKMKGLEIKQVQVDEMWGFIGAKAKTAKANGLEGFGDIWVWGECKFFCVNVFPAIGVSDSEACGRRTRW